MLKPLLLLPAVLLLGYTVASAPALDGQAGSSGKNGQAASSGKTSTEPPAHIKTIYQVDCGICHGANGDGKTDLAHDMALNLSDFTDPKTLEGKTDDQLFDLIRKGKDKMPPEETNRAKDTEVRDLIHYIRNMSKGQPAPAATPTAAPATGTASTSSPGTM